MDEQELRLSRTEILTDMKEWRKAHPRATYVQIEEEVHLSRAKPPPQPLLALRKLRYDDAKLIRQMRSVLLWMEQIGVK